MYKSKSIFLSIVFVSLLLILLPAFNAQAQDDTQPLDDEFIDALVMMSVNHGLMAGDNEERDLGALKDYVEEYYDDRIAYVANADTRAKLTTLKAKHSYLIQQKIESIQIPYLKQMVSFLVLFTNADRLAEFQEAMNLPDVVANNDNPPANYLNNMHTNMLDSINDAAQVGLDTYTFLTLPSAAPAISDSSGWSYNVPAITDSTAGSGGADFWGDSGDGDSGGQSSGPTDDILIHKPVRFVNNGFDPVTVVVESYEPAPGLDPTPSNASTVVFQETNPSASLSLPQGTYTFCYYWQLDSDYNNDDYFDYHHRTTSTVTLNENSSDNVNNAVLVTLSPDSNVSNPNGKCGEAPQGDGSLTPEEQANAGIHQYVITCHGEFEGWCGGGSEVVTAQVTFFNGGADVGRLDSGDPDHLVRIAENTYTWTNVDGDVWIYIFSMDRMKYYLQENGESDYFLMTRQD